MHFETSAFNLGRGDFSIILIISIIHLINLVKGCIISEAMEQGMRGNEGTTNDISETFNEYHAIRCAI